jgi:hypothetical protein
MKKNLFIGLPFIVAVIANFAFAVPSGAEEKSADKKTAPAKEQKSTTEKKTPDTPLVIPDPLPTDPTENAKIAKAILEKAEKNMKGEGNIKTYTTSEEHKDIKSDFVFGTKTFVKINPDGTEWSRLESLYKIQGETSMKTRTIYLSNDEGDWEIYGDTAVKWAFYKPKPSNDIEKGITINYDIKKSKHNEVNCYLVTERYMKSNEIVKVKQYSVGENDYFIYLTMEYDKNGKENTKMTMNHQNVKINIPLEDSLFKVKDSMKIVIANSIDEANEVYFQKTGEATVDNMKISDEQKRELKEIRGKRGNTPSFDFKDGE